MDSLLASYSAVLVTILSIAAYFFVSHGWKNKNWKNSPPGPVGWPILGILPHLKNPLHEDLFNLSKIHGPLYSIKLGLKPAIVVSSPETASMILKQHDSDFCNHRMNEAFRIICYDAMTISVAPMGTRWRVLRKILVEEVFSSSALKAFESVRNQQVHGLLKQLYSSSMSKNPLNIGEWAFISLANVVSNVVCSKSLFDSTEKGRELKQTFWEVLKVIGMVNISDIVPLLKPFDLQGVKQRTLKIFWKLDAFYENLINEKVEEREIRIKMGTKKEKLDMLDVVLEYKSERDDELRSLSRNIHYKKR